MNLPVLWLKDYIKEALDEKTLAEACKRWEITPSHDPVHTLGQLLTFAGFNLEEIIGEGDEAVLDLEVLANRPDAQCIIGLAREVAAVLGVNIQLPNVELDEGDQAAEEFARIEVKEPELCPRYTARIIRGVSIGPSPAWLQDRLRAMDLIPRNNIVDITNFVLFEYNQPLHAFDLSKLAGQQIIVRRANEKEPFTPLYDSVPPLTPETMVIADGERPVALAGVIGGQGTEVDESTTDILLESAAFNPGQIRRTSRRLKVSTDSSFRFERGVDLEGVSIASARATKLICELAGGTVAKGLLDSRAQPQDTKEVKLRHGRLTSLVGLEIPREETKRILETLGCETACETPEEWTFRIPSWRRGDLEREVDLIEEVARLYGYDKIPAETSMRAIIPIRSAAEQTTDGLKTSFTKAGYYECITDSLVDPKSPKASVWSTQAGPSLAEESVMREDHSQLRTSLLDSLLTVYRHNQDQRAAQIRLFECGKVYLSPKADKAEDGPNERRVVGVVDDRGFAQLSDAVLHLPEELSIEAAHIKIRALPEDKTPSFLAKGFACQLIRVRDLPGGERAEDALGWLGKLSPTLVNAYGLKKAPAVAEFDLDAIAGLPTGPRPFRALPSQPEITRDVAILVNEEVSWGEVESFSRLFGTKDELRDSHEAPRFLSVYRDKKLGADKKSLAFSIVYRAADRSLTDDEVSESHKKFVEQLLEKFQAKLRA